MAVEQITAFRTSSGKVFNDKNEAYQEELAQLYKNVPVVGKRGYSLGAVLKLVSEMEGLHSRCKALHRDMGMDLDEAVRRAFSRLMTELKVWINQAKALHEQMSTEKDAGVKAEIAKRE